MATTRRRQRNQRQRYTRNVRARTGYTRQVGFYGRYNRLDSTERKFLDTYTGEFNIPNDWTLQLGALSA